MVDLGTLNKGGKWVCPNDRQLALRAKLQTGWSVKTQDLQEYGRKPQALNETEQNIIKKVIERAELLDQKEQERVGRLVDRLDNMKRNTMGNGTTQCILCGDNFGIFGTHNFVCYDCKKLVCDKCGVGIISSSQETVWLCKICSETREMWKKSGAWFFKGLPKYKLPEKKVDKFASRKMIRPGLAKNNWSKISVDFPASSKERVKEVEGETSSEEEKKITFRSTKLCEEQTKSPQGNSLNVVQMEKPPKSPGTMSAASGSLFFNTSSDSGMGESEKNPGPERTFGERYQREVSNDSSGSNNSTFSRQTSSTCSESQPNLTSSTAYLSSINQSTERLSLSCEQSDCDRFPTPLRRSPVESFSETYDKPTKKLPTFGSKMEEGPKNKKKVSIDFGKAAAFLRHPLKGEKKKDSKPMEHSSSESYLNLSDDGWRKCRRTHGDFYTKTRQDDLEANHWMSQESGMDAAESIPDLNIHSKWRESMSSLSRDYYWTEDQISLTSCLSLGPFDAGEATTQNAQSGLLELSVWHDPARCCLHCTVHRAKGLTGTDANGLADPFCRISILPTTGKSISTRTKTVHRTINPEFNETVNFPGVTDVDLQRKILQVLVMDDGKCGNSFLGEARVPLLKAGVKHPQNIKVFLEKPYKAEEESVWEQKRWNRIKY